MASFNYITYVHTSLTLSQKQIFILEEINIFLRIGFQDKNLRICFPYAVNSG